MSERDEYESVHKFKISERHHALRYAGNNRVDNVLAVEITEQKRVAHRSEVGPDDVLDFDSAIGINGPYGIQSDGVRTYIVGDKSPPEWSLPLR